MNIPPFRVLEATECIIVSQMNPYKKLWSHPASISKMSRIFLPSRLVLFHELCLGFTFIVNSCAQTVNIPSNNINALKSQQKTFRYWLNVAWQSAMAIKYNCCNIQQQMKQNSKEYTICNTSLIKQRLFTMYCTYQFAEKFLKINSSICIFINATPHSENHGMLSFRG